MAAGIPHPVDAARDAPLAAQPLLAAILDDAPVAIAVLRGAELRVERANARFAALAPGLDLAGRPFAEVLPPAAALVAPVLRTVVEKGEPLRAVDLPVELARAGGDTGFRTFTFTYTRIAGEPGSPAVLVTAVETTAELETRRRLAAAVERLSASQDVTAALVSAHRVEDVLDTMLEKGLRAFAARGAMVKLPEGDAIALVGARGYQERVLAAFRRTAVDARTPNADAFRTGEPVWLGSRREIAEAYPGLLEVAVANGDAAWASIPLYAEARVIGVLGLSFASPMAFAPDDRAFIVSLARKCGHALDRARLFEAERAARAEAESLALARSRALELEASARERAEAAETEARRIGALQEQLTAVVGHDLRTPLAAITLAVRLLERGALDESARRNVARIDRSAARMSSMIRDLLDFSRARRGQGIPVELADIDLAEAIRGAVAEVRAAHPQREIRLAGPAPLALRGDAERLAQVTSNLVVNAVEHGPGEAPVDVLLTDGPSGVELAVRNDGPPIPEGLRAQLFQPFVRGHDGGGGSHLGLGLFIVREIVTAHRGTVEVRSAEGEGTTFVVRLPR